MKKENTILIVDDNKENLEVLFSTLEDLDVKLLIAKDGNQALKIASTAKPDIILLDIMMPEMDGYEVCSKLKKDKELRDISILFISALNQVGDIIKGLDLGAHDYISKPFNPSEVISRVKTQLAIKNLSLELKDKNEQLETQNNELLELQRIRDRMVSMVAHDLRGPINIVKSLTSMIDGNKDCLEMINDNLIKSEAMLNDLILASQSSKELKLTLETHSTYGFLHSIINNLQPLAKEYSINLNLTCDFDMDHGAIFDAYVLERVLVNLIQNAFKFSKAGSAVTVKAYEEETTWKIEVSDSGSGLTDTKNIFNLKESGHQDRASFGIGLYFCKTAIEAHEGTIEAFNLENGAAFLITLKL